MIRSAFAATALLLCSAAPAQAADLSALINSAVARGADAHPYMGPDAPADPLRDAAPAALDPRNPFGLWVTPGASGLDAVLRAGARRVNPGVAVAAPRGAALDGVFPAHEEWALWATEAWLNLDRMRALHTARDRIVKGEALRGEAAWVDAALAAAESRFQRAFDRKIDGAMTASGLDRAADATPRSTSAAIDRALALSPGLAGGAPAQDVFARYDRMEIAEIAPFDGFSSALGGATGADGLAMGVAVRVGFMPGALSYASTQAGRDAIGARVLGRNAIRRQVTARLGAAYDGRRAAETMAPGMAYTIARLTRRLERDGDAADARAALWRAQAAQINADRAVLFANAKILAATGQLFDRLYTGEAADTPRTQTATR